MKETKPLYLYHSPFCLENPKPYDDLEYILATTRDDAMWIAEEERLTAMLMKFLLDNEVVNVTGRKPNLLITHSLDTNMSSWIWHLNWGNMRGLVSTTNHVNLVEALKGYGQEGLNLIVDLHMRLGVLFDTVFLNTLVNRTLQAVQIIPYAVPSGEEETTWKAIHVETPYLWLVIYLQALLLSEIDPLEKPDRTRT